MLAIPKMDNTSGDNKKNLPEPNTETVFRITKNIPEDIPENIFYSNPNK
jgi:hypothetical protein